MGSTTFGTGTEKIQHTSIVVRTVLVVCNNEDCTFHT